MTKPMQCIVVTPEQTALSQEADFVALPLFDGELGVAPNHSPLIGRLGYGEMRIKSGSNTTRWYVDGGFVEVSDNMVSVLTNRAVPAGKVDLPAAEKLLEGAIHKAANSPELLEIRDRQIAQARAQVRVARRARL